MCRLQKVDFRNINLRERPGGWLAGDFPFDGELYVREEEIGGFLLANPSVMLDMAANLFYHRELGLSMTKMFYIFDEKKQNSRMLAYMNSLFERVSAWYELDDTGRKYLLIQGDGISEACVQAFEKLQKGGLLEPAVERLYLDSAFSNDVTSTGYYCLQKEMTEKTHGPERQLLAGEADRKLVRRLFLREDFRNFGSINVSGLSMEKLLKDPVLDELLELADRVYLYVFDICLKNSGEKTRKYVKILRWNF